MDQLERIGDNESAIRRAIESYMAELWTAMPGVIQSFKIDAQKKCTCVVQPTVKCRVRNKDGSIRWEQLPELQEVPVIFPRGGGFVLTFPIANGDECLIIFASRCIDTWWQQGGIQIPNEIRFHDLSDGFAIPGPYSLPKAQPLTDISTNSVQLRTTDGTCYVEVAPGGRVNIIAPGGLHVTGDIVASGEVTAKTSHTVSAHIHSDPQGGSTGTPTG